MLNSLNMYNKQELDAYDYSIGSNYTNLLSLFKKAKQDKTKEIQNLIQFTIVNRLMMLDLNCSKLFRSSIKESDVKYAHDSTEITMHLNSFYFHLSGIIDNLAWYLEYSLKILDIKIDSGSNRKKIGLHKKKNNDFLKKLKSKNEEIYNLILRYQEWFNDLNEKRDPVAHRNPIYVPPAVVENNIQHFKPIAYLDNNFILIVDSLVSDNKLLYTLCTSIVALINNKKVT
jgi:hypothetical protein